VVNKNPRNPRLLCLFTLSFSLSLRFFFLLPLSFFYMVHNISPPAAKLTWPIIEFRRRRPN